MKIRRVKLFLLIGVILINLLFASCVNVDETNKLTESEFLQQFDLTDPKLEFILNEYTDFYEDRVAIILKKCVPDPKIYLDYFHLDNAADLYMYEWKNPEREILIIYLKETGKDKVLEAVNELNKLEFVRIAEPQYIYGTADDNVNATYFEIGVEDFSGLKFNIIEDRLRCISLISLMPESDKNAAYEKYNVSFFEEKSLLIFKVMEPSAGNKSEIISYNSEKSLITVNVKTIEFGDNDDEKGYWMFVLELGKEEINKNYAVKVIKDDVVIIYDQLVFLD